MSPRGVIEFPRFRDLGPERINRDFQIHTVWTDGQATVEEVLHRAVEIGLGELAFTEHARATSNYYSAFFGEVDAAVRASGEPRVWRGFEIKAVDTAGALDMTGEMRAAADLVLGSVHSLPLDGRWVPARELPHADAVEREFALACGIADSSEADVLAHAGGMALRAHGDFPDEYLGELMRRCRGSGVAFEINASYHEPILERLLGLLEQHDPPVSIGSDAHRLDEVGRCRDILRARFGW